MILSNLFLAAGTWLLALGGDILLALKPAPMLFAVIHLLCAAFLSWKFKAYRIRTPRNFLKQVYIFIALLGRFHWGLTAMFLTAFENLELFQF